MPKNVASQRVKKLNKKCDLTNKCAELAISAHFFTIFVKGVDTK